MQAIRQRIRTSDPTKGSTQDLTHLAQEIQSCSSATPKLAPAFHNSNLQLADARSLGLATMASEEAAVGPSLPIKAERPALSRSACERNSVPFQNKLRNSVCMCKRYICGFPHYLHNESGIPHDHYYISIIGCTTPRRSEKA